VRSIGQASKTVRALDLLFVQQQKKGEVKGQKGEDA
jgi:hypothetical protein